MKKLRKLWLSVWQVPQHIVGVILLILYSERSWLSMVVEDETEIYRVDSLDGYRSYGRLFFVNKHWNKKHILNACDRESRSSRILGWFYLPWKAIKWTYGKLTTNK